MDPGKKIDSARFVVGKASERRRKVHASETRDRPEKNVGYKSAIPMTPVPQAITTDTLNVRGVDVVSKAPKGAKQISQRGYYVDQLEELRSRFTGASSLYPRNEFVVAPAQEDPQAYAIWRLAKEKK